MVYDVSIIPSYITDITCNQQKTKNKKQKTKNKKQKNKKTKNKKQKTKNKKQKTKNKKQKKDGEISIFFRIIIKRPVYKVLERLRRRCICKRTRCLDIILCVIFSGTHSGCR